MFQVRLSPAQIALYGSITAIVFAAISVRYFNLFHESLWFDEAVYTLNSYNNFIKFIENTRNSNSSPPLIPLFIFLLQDFDPAIIGRSIPFLFSVATIIPLIFIGIILRSWVAIVLLLIAYAFSPTQILYAQEVREYSAGIFFSFCIVYFFILNIKYRTIIFIYIFAIVASLAFFTSYNTFFVSLGCGSVLLAISLKRHLFFHYLLAAIVFAISIIICFFTISQYQFGIAQASYLNQFYFEGDISEYFGFFLEHNVRMVSLFYKWAIGFQFFWFVSISIALSIMLFSFTLFRILTNKKISEIEHKFLLIAFATLSCFLFLNIANILGFYPIGSIRQNLAITALSAVHLTAALLVIFSYFPSTFGRILKFGAQISVLIIVFGFIFSLYYKNRYLIYSEREDIKSAIHEVIGNYENRDVYIYGQAAPAVRVHFPLEDFYFGSVSRGRVVDLALEQSEFTEVCNFAVVYSHFPRGEPAKTNKLLAELSIVMLSARRFTGSLVIQYQKC